MPDDVENRRERRKSKIELSVDDIIVWADCVTNVPGTMTAKKLGISDETVYRARKKVKQFVAQHIDLDQFRIPLYGLYPLILQSLIRNLKACKEKALKIEDKLAVIDPLKCKSCGDCLQFCKRKAITLIENQK